MIRGWTGSAASWRYRVRPWPRRGTIENESAHPAPDILGSGHLARFSTPVVPRQSIVWCGGRRSLERVEEQQRPDGSQDGVRLQARVRSQLLFSAKICQRLSEVASLLLPFVRCLVISDRNRDLRVYECTNIFALRLTTQIAKCN
jgi:hypothetical protein